MPRMVSKLNKFPEIVSLKQFANLENVPTTSNVKKYYKKEVGLYFHPKQCFTLSLMKYFSIREANKKPSEVANLGDFYLQVFLRVHFAKDNFWSYVSILFIVKTMKIHSCEMKFHLVILRRMCC